MDISKHIIGVKSIPEQLTGKQLGAQIGVGIGAGFVGTAIGKKCKSITGVPGGGKLGLVLGLAVGVLGGIATAYSDDMLKTWLCEPIEENLEEPADE